MSRISSMLCAAALALPFLSPAVFADTAVTNSYRTFDASGASYTVGTAKTDGVPEALRSSLMFAFDCTRTNGWTITAAGQVKKIPNLVTTGPHAGRFLTMNPADVVDPYYFSAYRLYYDDATAFTPGTFVAEDPDGVLKGPYIDFGDVGSKKGLFFDAVEGNPWSRTVDGTEHSGTTANIMTNIGSVVGVYLSKVGAASVTNYTDGGEISVINCKEGGGNILAGANFQRFAAYSVDADKVNRNGVGLKFPLVKYAVTGPLRSGCAWSGLQKTAAGTQYWTGDWQVLAANPSTATLQAFGVGIGNVQSPDEWYSPGGQCIAELMLFDRVLTDDETRELVVYLERKWLGRRVVGHDGKASLSWVGMSDNTRNPPASPAATALDVPDGETLTVGRITGGRHSGSTPPQMVKSGAGVLKVLDSEDFGGEVVVRGGTLAFGGKKPVPEFSQLPPLMMLRFDASDESTLTVEDGLVSAWDNLAPRAESAYVTTSLSQSNAALRPSFVANALGNGLNVVDFGGMKASGGCYMEFTKKRSYQTMIAVVDARIYGGGHIMNNMFQRHNQRNDNSTSWLNADFRRLLCGRILYTKDDCEYIAPSDVGAAWVNGRALDPQSEGYEAPNWQVVALRVPGGSSIAYIGAQAADKAGGLRLAELFAWIRPLSEEEVLDAQAYLMKKWLGRVPGGYDDGRGVPELQNVRIGGEGAAVDVADGAVAKVGRLVSDGTAVKTGGGTLVVCGGGDLSSGLEVRGGKVAIGLGSDVSNKCEIAANPALRLDASDINSFAFVKSGMNQTNEDGSLKYGTTNFVWNWQDMSGRISALASDETIYKHTKPFLNTNEADLCNGLPTVDFGTLTPGWSDHKKPGRYLPLSRTLLNVRSVYLVLGSQNGGGQPIGSFQGENIDRYGTDFNDFMRNANLSPAPTDPLFYTSSTSNPNVRDGELWINGTRQESVGAWVPSGGYDLVELHVPRGCAINGLASSIYRYAKGGCRIGELVVFERPLSDREKTSTRNYLLRKWFGREESTLADLPARQTPTPLSGDVSFADGTVLALESSGGEITDPLSVTGSLTFGAGVTVEVSGFDEQVSLGDKLVLAYAGSCSGQEGITLDFGREFPPNLRPFVTFRNGKLLARFGRKGSMIIVR